jgi:hypothetical protein
MSGDNATESQRTQKLSGNRRLRTKGDEQEFHLDAVLTIRGHDRKEQVHHALRWVVPRVEHRAS